MYKLRGTELILSSSGIVYNSCERISGRSKKFWILMPKCGPGHSQYSAYSTMMFLLTATVKFKSVERI